MPLVCSWWQPQHNPPPTQAQWVAPHFSPVTSAPPSLLQGERTDYLITPQPLIQLKDKANGTSLSACGQGERQHGPCKHITPQGLCMHKSHPRTCVCSHHTPELMLGQHWARGTLEHHPAVDTAPQLHHSQAPSHARSSLWLFREQSSFIRFYSFSKLPFFSPGTSLHPEREGAAWGHPECDAPEQRVSLSHPRPCRLLPH